MKIKKLFKLVMALMFSVSLLGIPAPVSAQDAPYIWIAVNAQNDEVQVWGLENGTNVDLSIGAFSDTQPIAPNPYNDGNHPYIALFQLQGSFDILPGQTITAEGGGLSETMTVLDISISTIDFEAETISGSTTPGQSQSVYVGVNTKNGGFDSGEIYADENGMWFANFKDMGLDLISGTEGYVQVNGLGNSHTGMGVRFPDGPYLVSYPYNFGDSFSNQVFGNDWPVGAEIKIEIDDPTINGTGWDYTDTLIAQEGVNCSFATQLCFHPNPNVFKIVSGQHIHMTDITHNFLKEYTVTELKILSLDFTNDIISGTAPPNSKIMLPAESNDIWANRLVIADENGNWSADFSQPGSSVYDAGILDFQQDEMRLFIPEICEPDGDCTKMWTGGPGPGSISGTVCDESGTPITGSTITITAESPDGQVAYISADSNPTDGTYTINNLPLDTNMMITVYGNEVYGAEYYEEAVFRSLATVFNLTEATPTVSNVDFTLPTAHPSPFLEQLTFNVRAGRILYDPTIRKAIAYGTDRERILNKALLGNNDEYGAVLNSLIASGYWSQPAYNQVSIYPYNPAQARAILDGAGIIDQDGNGIRETVGGGDIILDFKTTTALFRSVSSAIFVENMAAIGIQINVTLVPADDFFSDDPAISPLVAGNFDIAEFAWGSYDQNLDDLYPWALYRTGNSQNHGGYSNATVDAEFDATMAATDRASMLPHVLAYYAEVTDNMPSLPLFSRKGVTRVATPSGLNVLANLSGDGVTVRFQNVAASGYTTGFASAIHPDDLPLDNTLLAVYEIGSSVTMSPGTGATICASYDDTGLTSAQENKLQLYHLTMTGSRMWKNVSTARNTTTDQVCGSTQGFSTFAVLLPNGEPPASFGKSTPSNGSINVSKTPVLSWGVSSGATAYEYCYDTVINGTCDGLWVSRGMNTSVTLSGLANNTTYYWQVRAKNASGLTYANNTSWWSFTTLPLKVTKTYYSNGAHDGWILESAENSNAGGTMNPAAATLSIGDNAQKKQYRSILSFATASLPDTAVITKVTLKLKHASALPAGTNPITLLQGIYVDVRKGFYGTSASLQLTDFNAAASKTVGTFNPALTAGWYTISLNSTTFASINKLAASGGLTQIRLRFKLDDNNNSVANILNLVSGNNATAANRPTLIIEYHLP